MYQKKYGVVIYAFVLQGNHYHLVAKFPNCNKSSFFRDFNARMAEAVRYYVDEFAGGPLFERRSSAQCLPLKEDVEDKFYYCALQPVLAGLTLRVSDYPGYNSFADAASGVKRKYKFFRRADYNAARRDNPRVSRVDFTEVHELRFSRLPGFESLGRKEYRNVLHQNLETRRLAHLEGEEGKDNACLTKEQLLRIAPGATPLRTKKGGRQPLVISKCPRAAKEFLSWYFSILDAYWAASKRYLSGDPHALFPPGTYKPPGPFVAYP